MMRARATLLGVTGLLIVFALSATPAAAKFRATITNDTQGAVNVIASGEFKIGTVGVTKCAAAGIAAEWHIQTKGQIKIHNASGKQEPTKDGPHLQVKVKNWGTCETKISGTAGQATQVGPCDLMLVQRQSGVASGGVATPCVVKVGLGVNPLCVVQIPAGMETAPETDQGINVGLLETQLTIGLTPTKAKVNVAKGGIGQATGEGIFYNASGINCTLPKPASENAELVGMELEFVNLEAT